MEAVLLVDQGAHANVMSMKVANQVSESCSGFSIQTLDRVYKFRSSLSSAEPLQCNSMIACDVTLRVRHGSTLVPRNAKWMLTNDPIDRVHLGWHSLTALGLENRKLLAAAADRLKGSVHMNISMKEAGISNEAVSEQEEGSNRRLMESRSFELGSTFHSCGGTGKCDADIEELYIDLSDHPKEKLEESMKKMIKKAGTEGMSAEGLKKLKRLAYKYEHIFRVRLGKNEPASITPMTIEINPGSRPVRVKARRYSDEQRKLLDKYITELVQMGFLQEMPKAEWQSAPLLVLKPSSKSKFRITVDLRPLNAATRKESWSMTHVESEIRDFSGSTCFVVLGFSSGYWQLPIDPKDYSKCGIITPRGVSVSTRVFQGLTNAVAYLQRSVEPLFVELRDNMKARIDDFNIRSKSEDHLLKLLERFFQICEDRGLYLSGTKCVPFVENLRWCGRVISPGGYTLHPRSLES